MLLGFAWLISLGGLVVLMGFIEIKKSEVLCKDVKIYIPGNQYFIDEQEVDNILQIHSKALIGSRKVTSSRFVAPAVARMRKYSM